MIPAATMPVGPEESTIVCPSCRQQVTTKVEYQSSTKTHIIALLLCLFGCWPCACCLYCTNCARDVHHFCPSCNAFLGVYQR